VSENSRKTGSALYNTEDSHVLRSETLRGIIVRIVKFLVRGMFCAKKNYGEQAFSQILYSCPFSTRSVDTIQNSFCKVVGCNVRGFWRGQMMSFYRGVVNSEGGGACVSGGGGGGWPPESACVCLYAA
jgi:hypothetical protein